MDVYTTEDEQIAAIKKWWKENWLSLFGGILIGAGILFGWKYWNDSKNFHTESASVEYEAMIQSLAKNQLEESSSHAATLLGQYADTPYAGLAALTMAKIKADKDDLVAAKSHLRWAMDNVQQQEVKTEAQIRLARILLAEGKHDEALQQVSNIQLSPYKAVVEELKGDIYVAKGDIVNARTAYSLALAELDQSTSGAAPRARNFIQIKLDDLGEVPRPGGEAS
ncbi:MAG: tetratricopeptide repeat protein [Gammaproteobacteria bacterium]|nr:tetratricopeptide repeat protein [Gammaproteobacteria bacterium]